MRLTEPSATSATDGDPADLARTLVAECIGTAFLLIGVVGSGIMAERRSDDIGLQLLENSIATAAILAALILAFATISGAHFNPVVTLVDVARGHMSATRGLAYATAQCMGAFVGVAASNVMFGLPALHRATTRRSGSELVFSEFVATFGLLLIVVAVARAHRSEWVALSVAAYIGGAYWFTSSTSFANPAVTLARTASDTFAGIDPADIAGFIFAQLGAAIVVIGVARVLFPGSSQAAVAD